MLSLLRHLKIIFMLELEGVRQQIAIVLLKEYWTPLKTDLFLSISGYYDVYNVDVFAVCLVSGKKRKDQRENDVASGSGSWLQPDYRESGHAWWNYKLCAVLAETSRGKNGYFISVLEIGVWIYLKSETRGLFLQFLSMKLATVNPRMEFNANAALSAEVKFWLWSCNVMLLWSNVLYL